ncbi:MAG: hypothetical protein ACK6BM_12395 [Cyanobacteriota bacterium]
MALAVFSPGPRAASLRRTPQQLLAAATGALLLSPLAGQADPGLPPAVLKNEQPIPGCAWLVKSNIAMSNWALPNQATTYWSHPYKIQEGEKLVLLGKFPGNKHQATRFFSLQTYDKFGVSVDTLFDGQIAPLKPGQPNPYTPKGALNPVYGRYMIEILPAQAGRKGPNQMWGYPQQAPGASAEVPYGVLMLRYIGAPDQTVNEAKYGPGPGEFGGAGGQGGVPLPSLFLVDRTNSWRPIRLCLPAVRAAFARDSDPGRLALPLVSYQQAGPVFVRPASTDGVFPNDANAYLTAQANYKPDVALLLEGRVPRTPNSLAGQAPGSPNQQLRYWSICVNENAYPIPLTQPEGCLDDQQVLHAPGRKGDRFLALVVRESDLKRAFTPQERQELRKAGVFVLNWFTEDENNPAATPTSSPITLLLRNVPSGRKHDPFQSQAGNVPAGSPPAVAQRVMGDYAVSIRQVPLRDVLREVRRRQGRSINGQAAQP